MLNSPLRLDGGAMPIASHPATSHRESDDNYEGVVIILNDRCRVIRCRDGIQWILQFAKRRRDGAAWESRSYCRTREGLIGVCTRHAGQIEPYAAAILRQLPERIAA